MPASSTSAAPAIARSRGKRIIRVLGLTVAGLATVAVCLAVRHFWPDREANAQGVNPLRGAAAAADGDGVNAGVPQQQRLEVVAVVNGEEIRREKLAQDCLNRYGVEVLESLINKQLILGYCQYKKIEVTPAEIEAEILRVAQQFRIPKEQYLEMLSKERGVTPEQYAEDILLPTLAMRKAKAAELVVTPIDLQAAYETQCGPMVEVRIIVCASQKDAEAALARIKAAPDSFGKIARELSIDAPTAAREGAMPPIRRYLGDAGIERAAFALQPGEVSQVVAVGDPTPKQQFVILKCEKHVPDQYKEYPLTAERKALFERKLREKKESMAAGKIVSDLRKKVKVVKVLGDAKLTQQYPGVAAGIGQQQITMAALAEECIARHGVEVLEGTISRRILEQQVRKSGVQVSQQDIDGEVVRAAKAMGMTDEKDQVNVQAWYELVYKEQGLTPERYLDDIVWPTAALKNYVFKMNPKAVQVADEDLQKGYEASFGPRVKCKAIVLNNQRTADEVWRICRDKGSNPIHFGQMAAQYSVDAGAKYLQGDVPPIQKHGGRQLLEDQAFALKDGEMSGIIQVGDKFVILLCLGRTDPIQKKFEEVKQDIYEDLYEKKLRIEMADAFENINKLARIENFLANTRQVPRQSVPQRPSSAQSAAPKRK
jgi:parvulin-like peptidyl-prolyl isomerase